MNSKFQQLIRDLEIIPTKEGDAVSMIRDFQKEVWQGDIQITSDRDRLIREVLADLAYDLDFIDPEKSTAWKNEIRSALSKLLVIAEVDDEQIDRMVEDLERPALESARLRKRRFIAGANGIKDDD